MLKTRYLLKATTEFAQALRDAGVTDLNGRELTEMAIHGVRPRFIREAREWRVFHVVGYLRVRLVGNQYAAQ